MPKRPIHGPCAVQGCGVPIQIKAMCGKHYRMHRIHGRTELKNTGQKRTHPLYSIWFERKQRSSLCEAWAGDFWAFVASVGKRPSDTHLLRPIRYDEPYGPNNFEWLGALKRQPGETREAFNARKWASRRERDPTYEPQRWLMRKYGLSGEKFAAMLEAQHGKCLICREPETRINPKTHAPQALAVDHCHKTGMVRGLLCWRCNTMLGKVGDSVDLLGKMIAYLRRSPASD